MQQTSGLLVVSTHPVSDMTESRLQHPHQLHGRDLRLLRRQLLLLLATKITLALPRRLRQQLVQLARPTDKSDDGSLVSERRIAAGCSNRRREFPSDSAATTSVRMMTMLMLLERRPGNRGAVQVSGVRRQRNPGRRDVERRVRMDYRSCRM